MEAHLPILRDSTAWFIACDPTTIQLTRSQEVRTDAGGFVPGQPVPVGTHVVKLIGDGSGGNSSGEGGSDRQWEYTIVFLHNADVMVGDRFKLGDTEWVIHARIPDNGYEIKVLARQYAKVATDG